ncbi:MAG: mechanosensitive ion channel family protein [Planctomycetes bacterium]|nr:mechanosensitive ion channel family protein [Planctomycetota bacterium]MBL7038214.1 mechanosensitive ion channel family protein [Pirellulaceae bacterium]
MNVFRQFVDEEIYNPATPLGAVFYAVVFLLLAWVTGRVLRFLVNRAVEHDRKGLVDRTAAPFLVQLARAFVYVVALLLYVHLIPQLRSVGTALLTGVSVASVVIGLAAQNTLGNLIGGIALLIYRPFRVGDRVQLNAPTGTETGSIETITLGYTILVTGDNRRVVVPNSVMANQITLNLTSVDPRVMVAVPIGIAYTADLDRAKQILVELASQHPQVQEVTTCQVTALGDSSVMLTVRAWCADAGVTKAVEFDLYEQAKRRFDEEQIEIPFPYTNVVLKDRAAVA